MILIIYFKNSLEFGIWINEQLFLYHTTWDIDVLKMQYPDLYETEDLRNAINFLDNADSEYEKWDISYYDWSSVYHHIYRKQEGDLPKEVWYNFLKKYEIIEELEVWAE